MHRGPSRTRSRANQSLEDRGGTVAHRFDEGALDFRTCGGAAHVQDTRCRVTAFPRSAKAPSRTPVEHGSEGDELVDPLGAFVHKHPNCGLVAQSRAGAQRVRQVKIGRVLVAGQHRRDTALSPTRRRLLQLALGEDADPGASELGEADRGGQACHPAPDHQDVEPLEPTHLQVHHNPARPGEHWRPRHISTPKLSIRRTGPSWAAMRSRSSPESDAGGCERDGIDHNCIIQPGPRFGRNHVGHSRLHLPALPRTRDQGGTPRFKGPEKHRCRAPVLRRETQVTARAGEAVGLAHGRAAHDLGVEIQVRHQAAHDSQLLEVLLAEECPTTSGKRQQLGHDRRHAGKMAGPGGAF